MLANKLRRMMQRLRVMGMTLGVLGMAFVSAAGEPPPEGRILFLGDSITYQGTYVDIIEAALITQYPHRKYMVINLGLGSETVSGLSEEGHAGGRFPRPDLNDRLDVALKQNQPDLVIACYGMNDGIYLPLDEDRFAAFRKGIIRLRTKVIAAGGQIIHLTPPVFDPLPIPEKVRGDSPKFFWGYNFVLDAYSEWLVDQSQKHGWTVWDLHSEMNKSLAHERRTDLDFTYARDGVHPNAAGHLVMAGPVLRNWGLKTDDVGHPVHEIGGDIFEFVQQKQRILRDSWLTQVGHKRPGVPEGLPLPKAEAQAYLLDEKAREIVKYWPIF